MVQLGLSSMDIILVAALAATSYFAAKSSTSVRSENRVTMMNSGWAESKGEYPRGNFMVGFKA
ncbi:hypothetical protein [Vibrio sp. HN007]|uniref:hypothetical protein n=1 Tax=Vibrio iocasae TaxID=3098914 RepID=UPI0035D44473